ncbi:MAG: hypothetical protein R3290_00650 [Acidimicrobiia bacterium]|nr:hypothetical protein [Acidimicrobiia bacterium]
MAQELRFVMDVDGYEEPIAGRFMLEDFEDPIIALEKLGMFEDPFFCKIRFKGVDGGVRVKTEPLDMR